MTDCVSCGAGLDPHALACVACGQLVHAAELKSLAAQAESAEREGRRDVALASWRRALDLLPARTRQHEVVAERVRALSLDVDAVERRPKREGPMGWLAAAGALVLFLIGKGKLLLLGLTKAGTLFSMLLSLGVYWTAFGWKFAAGLVVSIYVHEMGHVAWLRRYGIAASAPMFVPGLGAFVRLKQYPTDAREDARIGLAGPTWGLAAALAFWAVGTWKDYDACLAIAHVGAWINLFNLTPVWQLDGARGFRALSRSQRWLVVAATFAAWAFNGDGILLLVLAVGAWRALERNPPRPGDAAVALQFVGLVLALGLLARVHTEP